VIYGNQGLRSLTSFKYTISIKILANFQVATKKPKNVSCGFIGTSVKERRKTKNSYNKIILLFIHAKYKI
jgi:hypothetical protein